MSQEELNNKISEMHCEKDFISFVKLLKLDLQKNPDKWANISLEDFLDGIASNLEANIDYHTRNGYPEPSKENADWRVFAHILLCGKFYE